MLTSEQRRIVKNARDWLSDPEHFCAGTFAASAAGERPKLEDRDATRTCAIGALARQMSPDNGDVLLQGMRLALSLFPGLAYVNDELGREVLLALFDKVLAE
jgi:hypothetical protein